MSRMVFLASAAAGLVLLAGALSSRGAERRTLCPRSLVPAYVYPQEILRIVERPVVPRLLVVNPASGPGAAPDPTYRRAIDAARARGVRVVGYVPTGWATRPRGAVEADIARYAEWYGVEGVFLDEAAADEASLPYYRGLPAEFVVLNPGVVPARGYFDVADVVVTFEGPFAEYRAHEPPDGIDPARVAHLVYDAPRSRALEPGASVGYVYFTSGTLPHPWGTVPEYLASELAALGGCR